MPGILNPLMAACDEGYVPDEVSILTNPDVAETVDEACEHLEVIVDRYGGDAEIEQRELLEETNFGEIVHYYRSAIQDARSTGGTVAIDITPGRKFIE